MSSSGKALVPIFLLLLIVLTTTVIYGALEISDGERSALEILQDLFSSKKDNPSEKDDSQDMEISCTGPDQNGFYDFDEDGNCVLKGCYMGYLPQNNGCVKLSRFTGNEAVNCEISGYTYSGCTPKPDRKCGEGAGTREKYPNIEKYATGGGTCEYVTSEDCDIECPTNCSILPEHYSSVVGAACIGKTTDGESVTLGTESGYCGSGEEQLQIIPENIRLEDAEAVGFNTVEAYLAYANPGGVCPSTTPTACNVDCNQTASDGNPMEDIGCNYSRTEYAYISDKSGPAICFNTESVKQYLGGTLDKPQPLETITASSVRGTDGSYDMSLIPEDKKRGVHLLYRSSNNLSFDNLVKNKCHLYKTEQCDAPKESVDCVLGNNVPDTCDIFNGCGQSYSKTITRVMTQQAFGDGRSCNEKYGSDDFHGMTYSSTDNCQNADRCCEDSDYKPVEGTCSNQGFQTYRLNDDYCEKTNLLGDVSYEFPEEVTKPCPVNCVQSSWSDWGNCEYNNETGKYVKKRTRTTTTPALNDGTACGPLTEEETCPAVNCVQSSWSDWGNCEYNNEKGYYVKKRTRTTTTPTQHGGTACGPLTEEETCPAVNCVQSSWSDWGNCEYNNEKGYYVKKRTRTTTTPTQHGGTACGPLTEEETCPAVNCVQSSWSDWGNCEYNNEKGYYVKKRTRTTTTPTQHGGTACGPLTEEETCPAVNCVQSSWSDWGNCEYNNEKGKYVKKRTRTTTTPTQHGGTACGPLTEEETCPAVNCVMTQWGNVGSCDSATGKQQQTRSVSTAAQYGGRACGDTTQYVNCDVDCVRSDWTNSGGCTSEGKQKQTRSIITAPKNNGQKCGGTTRQVACTPTGFDNERFYIKDGYGNYLGQFSTNRWMGIKGDSEKTYFTIDGPFDNATIKGGINDKYCAQLACQYDSPEDDIYVGVGNMESKGYWTFEKQSDGGYKIRPKTKDGLQNRILHSFSNYSLAITAYTWITKYYANKVKYVFYLEKA
jgi:hypothetical protein